LETKKSLQHPGGVESRRKASKKKYNGTVTADIKGTSLESPERVIIFGGPWS
jgi:hypothetical protein